MAHDTRRITLISRNTRSAQRGWNMSPNATSRVIGFDSILVLRYAIASGLTELNRDVERLVLDRSTSATEYLSLLASLPQEFAGDVLLITSDDSGFLSSLPRGGDRVLYALSAFEVRFYLETNGLITAESAPELPMIHYQAAHATA